MRTTVGVWLGCLGGVALLALAAITLIGLVPVDETRYVGVALEMWQGGDFLVPRNNAAFYSDKPPLLFWLIHAGWAVFGVNAWWPRVAVAVATGTALVMTGLLARAVWPGQPAAARLAPVVLLGCLLWAAWTPAVMFDILLSLCVLIAVSGVWMRAHARGGPGLVLTAVGIGLGVLAKGPVILIHVLPVALLVPLWTRPAIGWGRWYAGIGVALAGGAAIALAWAVPAAVRGGSAYADAIFWGQSAGRVVDSFAHAKPVWWYLAVMPLVLFPWLLWWPGWRDTVRLRGMRDPGVRFAWCWALPAFAIMSMVSGKQLHYLLPVFPAAALIWARALAPRAAQPSSWWDAAGVAMGPAGLAALTAWLAAGGRPEAWPAWTGAIPPWTPLAFGLLALLALLPARALERRVLRLAVVSVLVVVTVLGGVLRPIFHAYDLGPVAERVAAAQSAGRPVAHVGTYHNRLRFAGRLTQPLAEVDEDGALAWACRHPQGLLVSYSDAPEKRLDPLFEKRFRSSWVQVVGARALVAASTTPCGRQGKAPAAG